MLRRLAHLLLLRALTAQSPATGGVGPLASLLAGNSAQIKGLTAAQNSTSYIIDPATGDATVVIGADISQAPVGNNTATPSFASTGLSGPGIASKHTGSWVQIA